MEIAIVFFTTIAFVVLVMSLLAFFKDCYSHVKRTKENRDWGKGTFNKFKEQFLLREMYKSSDDYFISRKNADDGNSVISYSGVVFGGKGMVLGIFDFFRMQRFLANVDDRSKNVGDW
jgi:hypothetical protein